MKSCKFRLIAVIAVIILQTLISNPAAQAFVYWSNSSGSATHFDWQNGGSDNGLFGDPAIAGDTFVFSPQDFRAESIYGDNNSVSLTDRLEFVLIADSGYYFQSITVSESGDYEIFGDGSVEVSGGLSVENLNTSGILSDSLEITPSMPVTGDFYIYDIWSGSAQNNIDTQDWTYIKIILQNDSLAITTSDGSIAWIQKKDVGTTISIQMIPEPATICLLSLGALSLIKRK